MSELRHRLPRFAALVLLAWLFATGVAFAHTCTSKIYLDCEDCCAEMKAVEAWTETPTVAVAAAQPAITAPVAVTAPLPAWQPAAEALAPWPSPPDPGGAPLIPIVFLRLAL